ncbi:hypothetical protein PSTG_19307, partial [Puccinia striiformis f. sp. tritici PST-78]
SYPQRNPDREFCGRERSSSSSGTVQGPMVNVEPSAQVRITSSSQRSPEPSGHHSQHDQSHAIGGRDRRALSVLESNQRTSGDGPRGDHHGDHRQRSCDRDASYQVGESTNRDYDRPSYQGDHTGANQPTFSTPTRHQSVPGAWPTSADRTTRVAPTSTTPSFYDSRSYGPASSAKP